MPEITIGLGIALSLFMSEFLGVTAGGIIVPGYIALYLHQPVQVLVTLLAALIVFGLVRLLGTFMFIYGKRRMVLSIILGFILGYLSRNVLIFPGQTHSLEVIGNIIPGLIANWMDRQGVANTVSALLITAVIVQLTVMLLTGGEIFV